MKQIITIKKIVNSLMDTKNLFCRLYFFIFWKLIFVKIKEFGKTFQTFLKISFIVKKKKHCPQKFTNMEDLWIIFKFRATTCLYSPLKWLFNVEDKSYLFAKNLTFFKISSFVLICFRLGKEFWPAAYQEEVIHCLH